MKEKMTIKTFSQKTNIPESTLRFYETKNLVKPDRDAASGYRLYSEEQIPTAKLIASLRQTDIPIQEIQDYLKENKLNQMKMKKKWAADMKERLKQLELSLHYLETSQNQEEIFLFEKAAEKCIWFEAEAPPGEFKEVMLQRRDELKAQGLKIHHIYLKFISGRATSIQVEIGYSITGNINPDFFPEGRIVNEQASLCIGLPFTDYFTNIVSAYRQFYQDCMENNWIPAGRVFEWYKGDQLSNMDFVMPILKMEGEKDAL